MANVPGYARSKDELLEAFNEQRQFLRSSADAFDRGNLSEAKRIATALYVLLHDGRGRTVSLVSQLNLQGRPFISSSTYIEPTGNSVVHPTTYLASITCVGGNRVELWPHCYRQKFHSEVQYREMAFRAWWSEPIFAQYKFVVSKNRWKVIRKISRMNLVSHVRSQDGGAHFDAVLDPGGYMQLSVEKNIGISRLMADGSQMPVHNAPHLVSLRQVAWEVEETFRSVPGGPCVPTASSFPPKTYCKP